MTLKLRGNLWPPILSLGLRTSTLSVPSLKSTTLLWKPCPGLCPEGPQQWDLETDDLKHGSSRCGKAGKKCLLHLSTGSWKKVKWGLFPDTEEQPFVPLINSDLMDVRI